MSIKIYLCFLQKSEKIDFVIEYWQIYFLNETITDFKEYFDFNMLYILSFKVSTGNFASKTKLLSRTKSDTLSIPLCFFLISLVHRNLSLFNISYSV